jgi:hypothetical protein
MGLTIETNPNATNDYDALVQFTVTSHATIPVSFGFAAHADICVDSDDNAPMTLLPGATGLTMWDPSSGHQFTFIGRHGGSANVDQFWYGPWSSRQSNLWSQVQASLSGHDAGMSFSWNRTIDPDETIVLSAVFRVGAPYAFPTITIEGSETDPFTETDLSYVDLLGTVSSPGDLPLRILVMVDSNLSLVYTAEEYVPSGEFWIVLDLGAYPKAGIDRFYTIWVMDSNDTVSDPVEIHIIEHLPD